MIEIALGIVLAVIILSNLELVLGCAVVLLIIALCIAGIGLVIFLFSLYPTVMTAILGLLFMLWVGYQVYQQEKLKGP